MTPLSKEALDSYIGDLIDSTTTSVDTTGQDEDEDTDVQTDDEEMVSYYTSSDFRRLLFVGISLLAVATTIWHVLFVVGPVLSGRPFVMTHFLTMGVLVFLTTLYTGDSRRKRLLYNGLSVLMALIIVAAAAYFFLEGANAFSQRSGLPSQTDIIMSSLLILVTLEGARRIVGLPFVLLGLAALAYGLFGNFVPGPLGHAGLDWTRVAAGAAFPNFTGILGRFMSLSASLITMFIFFGVFLLHLGGADFFGDFASRVAGRLRSGPAQVAIISSGFMGMLSGAAIANVAATGAFSIPLMKRLGYDRDFAGAVEATASTGGQITPPIMGATAFIMADIIGTSFFNILVAAAIPAFLFYATLMISAHLRAVRRGFEPIPRENMASFRSLLVRSYLFVPIGIIIVSLSEGDAAYVSAWKGMQAMLVLFALHRVIAALNDGALRSGIKEVGRSVTLAFDSASRSMASIMIVVAELGWIIEIFNMTGVFGVISSTLLEVAGGNLIFLLVMAGLIGIILGFGTPSIVAYLVVALLAAPAIVNARPGFITDTESLTIAAHMFVFYYAILSNISPPVAGACLVATGISKGNFLSTCKYAIRFALPIYIIPFVWIYNPALIANGGLVAIFTAVVQVLGAILLLAAGFENLLVTGYTRPERVLSFLAAVLLFVPSTVSTLVPLAGATLAIVLIAANFRRYVAKNSIDVRAQLSRSD
ncbi:MAG: TRAP transporter fused permease subunit [Halolamina sp.]